MIFVSIILNFLEENFHAFMSRFADSCLMILPPAANRIVMPRMTCCEVLVAMNFLCLSDWAPCDGASVLQVLYYTMDVSIALGFRYR